MKTVLTQSAREAAAFIKRAGVVAFPTETVYGLGANVFDAAAIAKIFTAKQRPADNPLIAHVGRIGDIEMLVAEVNENARRLIAAFFPGPLTLVLPKAPRVPYVATAGLETIGVRMPRHQLALEFLRECKTPLVAPSANLSGRPSPTTWQAVFEDLDGRIKCILQGEATEIGLESTVLDCSGDVPLVLRAGAITLEELQAIVPATRLYVSRGDVKPKSPGLKHRHYSPRANVVIVDSPHEAIAGAGSAYIGFTSAPNEQQFGLVKICANAEDYAHHLFDFFRACDHGGMETIYCQRVPAQGIGLALMDRLRRASQG